MRFALRQRQDNTGPVAIRFRPTHGKGGWTSKSGSSAVFGTSQDKISRHGRKPQASENAAEDADLLAQTALQFRPGLRMNKGMMEMPRRPRQIGEQHGQGDSPHQQEAAARPASLFTKSRSAEERRLIMLLAPVGVGWKRAEDRCSFRCRNQ